MQQEIIAVVDQSYLHPSGKFTVYRLVIRTFSKNKDGEKIAYKRFSDFVHLHRQLLRVHKAFGGRQHFPPLPKYHCFSRFSSRLIERRRQVLDAFVKFIARNEHLYCHSCFTRFIVGGFSKDFPFDSNSTAVSNLRRFLSPEGSFSQFPNDGSVSVASFDAISEETIALKEPVRISTSKPPKFDSPLSSDAETDQEGDTLPLLWMRFDPQHSKIVNDITSAKIYALNRNWNKAYKGYKDVISSLLSLINSCQDGTEGFRRLLSACLAKVEYIYREHLENDLTENPKSQTDVNHICPTWMEQPSLASLCQDAALSKLFGSVEELSELKICSIEGKDLVVCDRMDSSLEFTLKSLSLSPLGGTPSVAPAIASTDFKTPIPAERILPIGQVAFMRPLYRLLETPDHSRVFLLVMRARGDLRLVDWLSSYLQRRICSLLRPTTSSGTLQGPRNLSFASKHLNWCKAKSSRIRDLIGKYLGESGENFEGSHEFSKVNESATPECNSDHSTASLSERYSKVFTYFRTRLRSEYTIFSSLLLDPFVVLRRYPPRVSLPFSRSFSFTDGLPFLGNTTYEENSSVLRNENASVPQCVNPMQPYLLPQRQCILWAAQLVSVVSWLHEHHIALRHLDRSRVYLTDHGQIEIDYFFRWTDLDGIDDCVDDLSSYAPELLIGGLTGTFLCSRSWEKCVTCDWWSVGVILYEIFTGIRLCEVYPHGLPCDEPLQLPPTLAPNVGDFLSKLLKLNPNERLCGSAVKNHPLFAFIG